MKEAKGQKAYDSFEIAARTMLFRPTFTVLAPENATSVSSVHALVGPVLSLLEGCENARCWLQPSPSSVCVITILVGVAEVYVVLCCLEARG